MSRRLSLTTLLKYLKDIKGFEKCVQNINILSLGGGKCKAELKIGEEHSNASGGVHGGFSATLVDCVSTWALISEEKYAVRNVSVEMHMTYIKGAKVGDEIVIDASTLKAGKTLAFLEDVVSFAMTVTTIPTYIYELDGSHFFLGVIGSVSALIALLWNPIAGALSDRMGKKPILLSTLLLCFFVNFLLAYWPSLWVIFICRILSAFGMPINTFLKSLVDDNVTSKDERSAAINKMQAIGGICFIMGPLISGQLIDYSPNGITYAIYIISLIFLVNFGLILLVKEEHKKEKGRKKNPKSDISVLKELSLVFKNLTQINWKKYWDIVTVKFLYDLTVNVFHFNFGLILREHFGLTGRTLSYCIATMGIIGIVTSLLMIKVKNYFYSTDDSGFGRLNHATILLFISYLGLGYTDTFTIYYLWIIPVSIGRVLMDMTITEVILSRASQSEKGSIMGTMDSTMALAGLIAPLLSGIISDKWGEKLCVLLCTVPTLVSVVITSYKKVKVL